MAKKAKSRKPKLDTSSAAFWRERLSYNHETGVLIWKERPIEDFTCAGYYRRSRGSKWLATITVNGKSIYLGVFKQKSAATAARKTAEKLFGFHPNHGRVIP